MSETKRPMVSILSTCNKWVQDAEAALSAAKQHLQRCNAANNFLAEEHDSHIKTVRAKLNSIEKTIGDVREQGGDATSLESKRQELRTQLDNELKRGRESAEFLAAARDVEGAQRDVETASALAKAKKECRTVAQSLLKSYELDSDSGANEAPEYETLEEAIQDYLLQATLDVAVKQATIVDRVAVWRTPEDQQPCTASVAASTTIPYVLKVLPPSLTWLEQFPSYAEMLPARCVPFVVGQTSFSFPDAPKRTQVETGIYSQSTRQSDPNATSASSVWPSERPPIEKSTDGSSLKLVGMYFRSGTCYVKNEDRFYCIKPHELRYARKDEKAEQRHDLESHIRRLEGREITVTELQDSSTLFGDLTPHVEAAFAKALKEFPCLETATEALAVKLRENICSVASTETLFAAKQQRLSQDEVLQEIGRYWRAFLDAPWEPSIASNCALLKHLCERKLEEPHFYSFDTKGHYGLRVRTRDHDWIVAELYCPPSASRPTEVSKSDVSFLKEKGGDQCIRRVTIGPCCMYIQNRER
jgi:hypothetical protein